MLLYQMAVIICLVIVACLMAFLLGFMAACETYHVGIFSKLMNKAEKDHYGNRRKCK